MTPNRGSRLGDRYRLDERIAAGGMGEVWRGTDELLGRSVAVKVLQSQYADDPDFLARFRAEARHTAALSHPGIANVFDYGEAPSDGANPRDRGVMAYLVMELVEGEPLSGLLAREGRLDPPQVLDILAQAGAALQAAHDAGVIHRDVKPGNLIIRPDGVVKVTDFGIARAADSAAMTSVGTVVGTAYYLSPEQASGRPVTFRSDVYSLGIVGYELLTGRRPFEADNPLAVTRAHLDEPVPPLPVAVPREVRELIVSMLAKDPAARPGSARAVAGRARELLASLYGEKVHAGGADLADVPTRAVPVVPAPVREPSPTRRVAAEPPRTARVPVAAAGYEPAGYPPAAPPPRRFGVTQAVLLLGGLAIIALGVLLYTTLSGRPPRVAVPGVVQQMLPAAERTVSAAGFVPEVKPASADQAGNNPPGTVVAQSPDAQQLARRGSAVRLFVVSAPDQVVLNPQDYLGRPASDVRSDLGKLNLQVRSRPVAGQRGQDEGTVAGISPSGPVDVGQLITIDVYGSAPSPTPTRASPSASPSLSPSRSPSASPSASASPSRATPTGAPSTSSVTQVP